jgi:hypothetical protein
MIPRLANRATRQRPVRRGMGEPGLESLAAEFALLAQRRSRAIHQMKILEQQRAAAASGFAKLQKRIAWLIERIDHYGPALHEPAPVPETKPAARPVAPTRAMPALSVDALAAIGRQWVDAQPATADHPARPRWAKRT